MSEVEYVERGEAYTPPPPTQPPPPPQPPADGQDEPLPDRPESRLRRFVPRSLTPRPRLRSLTTRLVTGVVALVVVLVLLVGSATVLALRSFLNQRFEQQLQSTTAENTGFFDRCVRQAVPGTDGGLQCVSGPQTQREWVLAYDPDTDQIITFKPDYGHDLKPLRLTTTQLDALVSNPDRTLSVRQGGESLRVTAGRNSQDGLLIVTGLATSDVTKTLSRLLAIELIIGAGAVGLALVATTSGVQFSLRRLRAVTTTAQDVASELSPEGAGLDRRVHDTDDTTEVGELATSFNTMLGAVEMQFAARLDSERRMRQFLADASHELRTPLTSIRGYAELARMQRDAGDTSADNLDRIESEGTRMSRLVEDLLTLARGDADDREPQRELIEVSGLVDDAASGSRAAFPSRRIDVQVGGAPLVIGDRDQLLRVVRNLVTNAAIHTAPDRPITVRAFADAADVSIQVIDGGPGLAPEDAAHVFERFWRADKARTRARGGSGLGLSIVATIVRAHGGTVRFDSSVESGSTVTVVLPAAHQSAD